MYARSTPNGTYASRYQTISLRPVTESTEEQLLAEARAGDIKAFQALYTRFHDPLKSYLYRLMASRADAEDLAHDAFIRAFDKLGSFAGRSSLKTWVFRIATNLAYNELQKRKRWSVDVSAQAKDLVMGDPRLAASIELTAQTSPYGTYEIREHISTCFACIGKTLPIENQVALLLKDVYDFRVAEIMQIMERTEGVIKYLLQTARKTMTKIFAHRCALVNKNGVCHQCSELNGWLNPKQAQQAAKLKIAMVRAADESDQRVLYRMRTELVKAIDPLQSPGHELQEVLMDCNRQAMSEPTN